MQTRVVSFTAMLIMGLSFASGCGAEPAPAAKQPAKVEADSWEKIFTDVQKLHDKIIAELEQGKVIERVNANSCKELQKLTARAQALPPEGLRDESLMKKFAPTFIETQSRLNAQLGKRGYTSFEVLMFSPDSKNIKELLGQQPEALEKLAVAAEKAGPDTHESLLRREIQVQMQFFKFVEDAEKESEGSLKLEPIHEMFKPALEHVEARRAKLKPLTPEEDRQLQEKLKPELQALQAKADQRKTRQQRGSDK